MDKWIEDMDEKIGYVYVFYDRGESRDLLEIESGCQAIWVQPARKDHRDWMVGTCSDT